MTNKKRPVFQRLANHEITKSIIFWAKKRSLPGLKGLPVYDVFLFIIQEIKKDDLTTRANSIAFSFFISLFPTIIMVVTLFAYLPIEDFKGTLLTSMEGIIPHGAESFLNDTIDSIIEILKRRRVDVFTVGFILAVFFSSNGMLAMMRGFDKSYDTSFKKRSFLRKRAVAVALTFLVCLMLIITVFLEVAGTKMLAYLVDTIELGTAAFYLGQFIKWLIIVLLFYSVISALYYFGPALKKKMSLFSAGASIATFSSIASSIIFSYYVNSFDTYNRIYGTIGTLIAIMLWIQINSFILLVGFELNASIAVNRDLRTLAQKNQKE